MAGGTTGITSGGRPRLGSTAASVLVVMAMSGVSAIGFRSTLSGWSFVSAAAIGAIGASVVVLVARRRHLLLGESVAISAVAFAVVGGVAVGGVPTPGAYASFFRGLIDGWSDLLSAAPPADLTDELRALPFTVAWLAAAVGGELARRGSRRPGLPALGPLLALALSLLFTVEERWLALLQGALLLACTLALIALATRRGGRAAADGLDDDAVSRDRRRLALGAVVAVAAVVVAPLLGPRLPFADAHERFDLRRYQVPPFDPLAVPSPLVQLKASLKDERRDDVVFVVRGDAPIDRWPVAVMADYDGVVWTVADPEENRRGTEFVPVDTVLPELDSALPAGATTTRHTVEIVDLDGVFLPLPGRATELRFPDERDPRLNRQTGTVALPGGVTDGLTYDVTAAVDPTLGEAELAATTVIPVDRSEELKQLQPVVRNLAADLTQGRNRGWDQMAAIRDEFVDYGFYDSTEDTPPGHSEARLALMLEDPTQIIGYEEQYAAAAALIARVVSLPTRVVVGYRIPEASWTSDADGVVAEVSAGDIAAWVELDTGPTGWVPVDVTPDRSRTPDPESQGRTTEQIAIPNPPPPPPPPPEVQPPRQEDEEVDDDEGFEPVSDEVRAGAVSPWAWVAIGGGGGPLVLLVLGALAVVVAKAIRRRRRRRHRSATSQVAGAWAEAVDRCRESGHAKPDGATPHETVGIWVHDGSASELRPLEPQLRRLADELDRAAYAVDSPSSEHVAAAWSSSDTVADELRRDVGAGRRLRMRLDPRPLLRDETRVGR